MPRITDTGILPDDPAPLAPAGAGGAAVLLSNDADPAILAPHLARTALVVIPFPGFADGRGFSLAHRLRGLGFTGRLRARGHLIPDQYAYARACGFDEVEIDTALMVRQGTEAWRAAAARVAPPFRRRLGARE